MFPFLKSNKVSRNYYNKTLTEKELFHRYPIFIDYSFEIHKYVVKTIDNKENTIKTSLFDNLESLAEVIPKFSKIRVSEPLLAEELVQLGFIYTQYSHLVGALFYNLVDCTTEELYDKEKEKSKWELLLESQQDQQRIKPSDGLSNSGTLKLLKK